MEVSSINGIKTFQILEKYAKGNIYEYKGAICIVDVVNFFEESPRILVTLVMN
jgi:hypothetical protein